MAAITVLSGHVAPSVDDNNRYLKLTPLGDRVRLAYTIFYGEVPGASARKDLDVNHDGHIDDAEAHAFGERIASAVQAALDVEVDGRPAPVSWETIDVGMGTPVVAAGAFSVDLVAYLCLAPPRGAHHVIVKDRFVLPRPGETEVKVEDSLGVQIDRARLGEADDPAHDYRFNGPAGPLASDGLDLAFTANERAPVTGGCGTAAPPPRGGGVPAWVWYAVIPSSAISTLVVFLVLSRRRGESSA